MSQRGVEDQQQAALVQTRYQQLVNHLRANHANERRVQAMFVAVSDVRLMPEYVNNSGGSGYLYGLTNTQSGLIELAAREKDGTLRTESGILNTLVHELAHATLIFDELFNDHGPRWKEAYLWLANVATKELGWQLEVQCRYCKQYSICYQAACPQCSWLCPSPAPDTVVTPLPARPFPGFGGTKP